MNRSGGFTRFATATAHHAGHPTAFVIACTFIVLWAIAGPFMGFSERWQLIVNTGTTIVTFLMVFIIQNTQNRDSTAVHVKLDELIRVNKGAHNSLLDIEELSEDELEKFRQDYEKLAAKARKTGKPKPIS